ncbi:DinB family protein [Janibacter sp. G1551]|uniref:DinB family protein n=1 Tax=Janibacter sp. G1551 TaxID=3420440 RepID=UPI003D061092
MSDERTPEEIVPDDKDWTWVLERSCPDCGFDSPAVQPADVARLITDLAKPWPERLGRTDARRRPEPGTWSPLEYGAHVRDVCRVFTGRLELMLTKDDPAFPNWDQDQAALADDYGAQDPAMVGEELIVAADAWAAAAEAVSPDEWDRTGLRSNGSRFTALTLSQYGLHDLAHHLVDVGFPPHAR